MYICSQAFVRRGGCFEVKAPTKLSHLISVRLLLDFLLDALALRPFLDLVDPARTEFLEVVHPPRNRLSPRAHFQAGIDEERKREDLHQLRSLTPIKSDASGHKETLAFRFPSGRLRFR